MNRAEQDTKRYFELKDQSKKVNQYLVENIKKFDDPERFHELDPDEYYHTLLAKIAIDREMKELEPKVLN